MTDSNPALSFGKAVAEYERGRPGYPDDAIEWMLDAARLARHGSLPLGTNHESIAHEAGLDSAPADPTPSPRPMWAPEPESSPPPSWPTVSM